MTITFTVQNAYDILRNELFSKFHIILLDKEGRTKSHSFAIGSITGKQFAIILGEKDADGNFTAKPRIITEKRTNPNISGAKWSEESYGGGKINQLTTSLGHPNHLRGSNQSSFYIETETAFRDLISWYSKDADSTPVTEEVNQHSDSTHLDPKLIDNEQSLSDDIISVTEQETEQTTKEQLIQARLGQGKFRKNVIKVWGLGECCAVTGTSIKPLLIASHIISWRDSNDDQRLSGCNGILLCSHLDKFFDQHLISFDSDGKLIASSRLSDQDWGQLNAIGIHKSLRLNTKNLNPEIKKRIDTNLAEHRNKLQNP